MLRLPGPLRYIAAVGGPAEMLMPGPQFTEEERRYAAEAIVRSVESDLGRWLTPEAREEAVSALRSFGEEEGAHRMILEMGNLAQLPAMDEICEAVKRIETRVVERAALGDDSPDMPGAPIAVFGCEGPYADQALFLHRPGGGYKSVGAISEENADLFTETAERIADAIRRASKSGKWPPEADLPPGMFVAFAPNPPEAPA